MGADIANDNNYIISESCNTARSSPYTFGLTILVISDYTVGRYSINFTSNNNLATLSFLVTYPG